MSKDFDIEKLKGSENYHTWNFAIKNLLEYKGLAKCITDPVEETKPEKLSSAKALLSLCIDKSLYAHICKCDSASAIWKTLQNLYEDKGLSRKIGLLRQLISIRLEDCDGMERYVDQMVTASNKLGDIGFEISSEWKAAILLAGLTENYKPFIMGIEASGSKLTDDLIITKLLDTPSSASGEAFFGGKKSKKKKTKSCYSCGGKNHTSDECFKKKNGEHSKAEKSGKAKNAFCALLCETDKMDFYIDSGASNHLTPHGNLLTDKKEATVTQIISANNAKLKVKQAGNLTLNVNEGEIEVGNVLHVPGLVANLLSVYKIVQSGNSVLFNANGCTIKNKHNETIATCKAENGVYRLRSNSEKMCMMSTAKANALTWHRRLGHLNYQTMQKMKKAVSGIEYDDDDSDIKKCEICASGKQNRAPFAKSNSESTRILELIHTDVMGPMETQSIGKAKYILTFIDDYSRKVFCYFIKAKSEVFDKFVEFKSLVENQADCKIKVVRSDNGGEYVSERFDRFFKKHGIQHQTSAAYTPQQNGRAERMNRTLVEKARCLLFDADLPKTYWAEAVNMAVYITNRTLSSATGKVPDEMFFKKKIDISNLKIFGSSVMVHIPKEKRLKWDKKSSKHLFVGYDDDTKGFRCIDKSTRKLTISRDVIFHEDTKPELHVNVKKGIDLVKENGEDLDDETNFDAENDTENDAEIDAENGAGNDVENNNENHTDNPTANEIENGAQGDAPEDDAGQENDDSMIRPLNRVNNRLNTSTETDDEYELGNETLHDPDYTTRAKMTEQTSAVQTRSKSVATTSVEPPNPFYGFAFFTDPSTLKEAKNSIDSENWKEAMNEEIASHRANQTWTLVDLPAGRKPINAKWVYKTKRDDSGAVVRYKARLVAKGYAQRMGIDYTETYAPVVRYASIRLLMALAVKYDYSIHQMDVITAFLQGDLREDIFMNQPEDYNDGSGRVCKLNRSIYGLKQAGHQWNLKLDGALQRFGLVKSKVDPCIYKTKNLQLIIAIYVDDFLILYKKTAELDSLKQYLNKNFMMKDLGSAKSCLGIRISQQKGVIQLDQAIYIENILERFGMINCKPVGTPADTSTKLSLQDFNENDSLVGRVPYQEAIGSLLYVAQATRPDIAFAVNDASRFNLNHAQVHWLAVKRIFRYLKGTMAYKLTYRKMGPHIDDLHAYVDSDWASEIDERRSCTGFVIMMTNGAINWCSKRQPIVALSSTEAEYIALSSVTSDVLWTKQLRDELDNDKSTTTTIYCDNESAIKIAESDAFRPRTKHIDIRFHHIREKVENGVIGIRHIPTQKMIADSLTKAVAKNKHTFCANAAGLEN